MAAVFSGEVVEIVPFHVEYESATVPRPPIGSRLVSIRIDRSWVGGSSGVVQVHTGKGDADCGFPFRVGEQYLVYARDVSGRLQASACSRTRLLSDAAEDLKYLDELSKPSPGGRIIGTITGPGDPRQPLPGVRVRMGNASGERATVTGADGGFEFPFLPVGAYGVQPEVPETHRVHGPAHVEVRDRRGCAVADFSIVPDGRISLFVLDHDGRPASRVTVELIRLEDLSSRHPHPRTAQTLADGSVGWDEVPPGRYVIGLNILRRPGPRQPAASLFYPGVSDRAGAHEFAVGTGERIELDTWRLPRWIR